MRVLFFDCRRILHNHRLYYFPPYSYDYMSTCILLETPAMLVTSTFKGATTFYYFVVTRQIVAF